jgi:hypothetical protein
VAARPCDSPLRGSSFASSAHQAEGLCLQRRPPLAKTDRLLARHDRRPDDQKDHRSEWRPPGGAPMAAQTSRQTDWWTSTRQPPT